MKVWNSYLFYVKLTCRTWVMPLLLVGNIGLILYPLYLYSHYVDNADLGGINPASPLVGSYGIFSLILTYLFFGVYVTKLDETASIAETFGVVENSIACKTLAKSFVALSAIILSLLVLYLSYLVLYVTSDFHSLRFFLHVGIYMLLYWGLTPFVMFLIGSVLALVIRNKLIYPLILMMFVLLSPMNAAIFPYDPTKIYSIRLDRVLNLGEPNMTRSYNSFYGFALEPIRWTKSLFCMALLCLFTIFILKKRHTWFSNGFKRISFCFLLIACITFTYIISPHQTFNDDDLVIRSYYDTHRANAAEMNSPIAFSHYDIHLQPKGQLNAFVKIKAENMSNQIVQSMKVALYHELHIQQIKLDGKAVSFEQKQDFVNIHFSSRGWAPHTEKTLEFTYAGLHSNLYFANTRAIYLPNYLSWLPSEELTPAFQLVSKQRQIHRLPRLAHAQKSYDLYVNSGKEIYSNLPLKSEQHWSGTTDEGVSIISGQLTSKKLSDFTLVYPNDWESEFADTTVLHRYVKAVTAILQNHLHDQVHLPKSLYFLPNENIGDGFSGEGTWWNKTDLIFGFRYYDRNGMNYFTKENMSNFTYRLVLARTKASNEGSYDYEFNVLFASAYAQAINAQLHLSNEEAKDNLDFLLSSVVGDDGEKLAVKRLLLQWMKQPEAYDTRSPLHQSWYKLTKDDTPNKWTKLKDILKEKEGTNDEHH
ncbi:hypothetical protein [Priestia koreensis]|uniref:hypothetical protein n=1 Tax=Priestia koreensis TaxID=284581 RepID=UPI001F55E56E|nr:hypothetical protein [Priestia koreensis]UNL83303.1 hypothetical protein IE339_14115 [Priestia koreensis]